jgi:hypothetical protein
MLCKHLFSGVMRLHFVSTLQVVMAVGIASDDDTEAWGTAALRDTYRLVE